MRKNMNHPRWNRTALLALALPLALSAEPLPAGLPAGTACETTAPSASRITGVRKINPTTVEVYFADSRRMTIDFYGENIFRLFRDDAGGIIRNPKAQPEAQILVNNPRMPLAALHVDDSGSTVTIATGKVKLELDKQTARMKATNLETVTTAFEETAPAAFAKGKVTLTLKESPKEYFYGGGVQNGRFSHKGKAIAIENQNSWTDGGVASPTPFYWSTAGYGILWHTFKKGRYDFVPKSPER